MVLSRICAILVYNTFSDPMKLWLHIILVYMILAPNKSLAGFKVLLRFKHHPRITVCFALLKRNLTLKLRNLNLHNSETILQNNFPFGIRRYNLNMRWNRRSIQIWGENMSSNQRFQGLLQIKYGDIPLRSKLYKKMWCLMDENWLHVQIQHLQKYKFQRLRFQFLKLFLNLYTCSIVISYTFWR